MIWHVSGQYRLTNIMWSIQVKEVTDRIIRRSDYVEKKEDILLSHITKSHTPPINKKPSNNTQRLPKLRPHNDCGPI